jgi:predicted O-methyltransferase YrrM
MGLRKGAEIGVAGGVHSESLLQNIEGCELLCVDHWGTSWSKKLESEARARLAPYNATLVKASSMEAARDVADGSLDFVYIDAAHDFDHVMEDLITWSRKVKPGGIVSGHDYDRGHRRGVIPAVNAYTRAHNIREWFLTDPPHEASFIWMKPEKRR